MRVVQTDLSQLLVWFACAAVYVYEEAAWVLNLCTAVFTEFPTASVRTFKKKKKSVTVFPAVIDGVVVR